MAGHSKWANIKRTKAVVDAKKGVVYAKMAREIIVAAKMGGGDPDGNFRLRQAIDRAKVAGVPNDNIQRAIEKGSGSGSNDQMEELVYEGYGPGGVAMLVHCATDNRNRTAGDIRSYFSKCGGNLGESNCVSWMFKERGEISLESKKELSEETLLNAVVEAGAEDFEIIDQNSALISCLPPNLEKVSNELTAAGYAISSCEVVSEPQTYIDIESLDTAKMLLKLMDLLENHDDVQRVSANFNIADNILAQCD